MFDVSSMRQEHIGATRLRRTTLNCEFNSKNNNVATAGMCEEMSKHRLSKMNMSQVKSMDSRIEENVNSTMN